MIEDLDTNPIQQANYEILGIVSEEDEPSMNDNVKFFTIWEKR